MNVNMSNSDKEQLKQWLKETEDDYTSVLGFFDEEANETEEDDDEFDDKSLEEDGSDIDDESLEEDCSDIEMHETSQKDPLNDPQQDSHHFLQEQQDPLKSPEFVIGRNGVTKWYSDSQVVQSHNIMPVDHQPGPIGIATQAHTPTTAFQCMIDDETMNKIVTYTNVYINKIRPEFERERDATLTDVQELRAFIGILYLAGVLKKGRRNVLDMWDNSKGTGIEAVYLCMSAKRFRFLQRCVQFDNIHTREERKSLDKFAEFREVFEQFVDNFKNSYNPTDYLTVDEQLLDLKGNCPFKVLTPSKPTKFGMKIYALVSATNFYTTNLEVHVGKQPDGPFRKSTSTQDLVLRLVEPIAGSNRNITCANRFISVALALKLLEEKKLTITGTLKRNTDEVPEHFLTDARREKNSSIFGFHRSCTLVSYGTKKNEALLAISTMHDNATIDPESGKPVIIASYNEKKLGVKRLDKLCTQYDTSMNSRRWDLTLFFHILNIAAVNSLIIYKANKNQSLVNRMDFLKSLAFDLTTPHIQYRISLEMLPKEIKVRGKLLLKIQDEEEDRTQHDLQAPTRARSGRCYLCGRARSKSTRKRCFKCTKWVCGDHLRCVCDKCM